MIPLHLTKVERYTLFDQSNDKLSSGQYAKLWRSEANLALHRPIQLSRAEHSRVELIASRTFCEWASERGEKFAQDTCDCQVIWWDVRNTSARLFFYLGSLTGQRCQILIEMKRWLPEIPIRYDTMFADWVTNKDRASTVYPHWCDVLPRKSDVGMFIRSISDMISNQQTDNMINLIWSISQRPRATKAVFSISISLFLWSTRDYAEARV